MVTTGRWDEEVPPPARRPLGEPGTAIPRYGLLLPGACDMRAALLRVLQIDDAEVAWAAARAAAGVPDDVDTFTPAQFERAATALVELGGMVTLVGSRQLMRARQSGSDIHGLRYGNASAFGKRGNRADRAPTGVGTVGALVGKLTQ
jgi:hypothetical protein